MAESISFGEVNLDVEAGRSRQPAKPRPETPFRVAVIGDFSGRSSRLAAGGEAGSKPRAILVDRDNLDAVMAKLGVRLALQVAGESGARIELGFRELDDFDPDRIYERVGLFRSLRESRKRLADPKKFEMAAAELGLIRPVGGDEAARERPAAERTPAGSEADEPGAAMLSGASLLEGALEATEERSQGDAGARGGGARRGGGDDLSEFLRRAVAPYAVADPHPKQDEVLRRWDEAIRDQMQAVMHHPEFQALEATWRGVHLLTRRLETGTELKVYVVDCSKQELAKDLETCGDLRACRLAQVFNDPGAEWAAEPGWAVFVGLYRFDATVDDAISLARLSVVAGYLGAPFVAEAVPSVFGCGDLSASVHPADWKHAPTAEAAQSWDALRAMPQARYLALAAPRFLLRLPYGEETVPTEMFRFEEVSIEPSGPAHEDYLWGNPAVAVACVLGENFSRHGWEMRPGAVRELDSIPMHLYKLGGEARQLPCAEAWLGERAAEEILDHGVLPLLSIKDRDRIVLFDLRSLAAGDEALAGPWDC